MAFSLIPDGVYPSIYQIDGKALARRGITLLLADLDNTLAKYGQPEPDPALLAWKEDLSAAGVGLGSIFGARMGSRAELAGGLILILMGLKILLEHLGLLP